MSCDYLTASIPATGMAQARLRVPRLLTENSHCARSPESHATIPRFPGGLASSTWVIYLWVWGWLWWLWCSMLIPPKASMWSPLTRLFPDVLSIIHLLLAKTKLKRSTEKSESQHPEDYPAHSPMRWTGDRDMVGRTAPCLPSLFFLCSRLLVLFFPCRQCAASYTDTCSKDSFNNSIRVLCNHPHIMQHSKG